MNHQKGVAHLLGLFLGSLIIFLSIYKIITLPARQAASQPQQASVEQHTPTPTPTPVPVELDNLMPYDLLSTPAVVKGTVQSGWMFEGTFMVTLRDDAGQTLTTATVKELTPGSWQQEGMVPFQADIKFSTKAKTGYLVFQADNPSGLPENDKSYEFPVTFQKSALTDNWKTYQNSDLALRFKYPSYWQLDSAKPETNAKYLLAGFSPENYRGGDVGDAVPLRLQIVKDLDKEAHWYLLPENRDVKKSSASFTVDGKRTTLDKYETFIAEGSVQTSYVYSPSSQNYYLIFTYAADGCQNPDTQKTCALDNRTNAQKNLDNIRLILETFEVDSTASLKQGEFTCPAGEWVNCMPGPDRPADPQCQPEFLTWASNNCPGFKGAAL